MSNRMQFVIWQSAWVVVFLLNLPLAYQLGCHLTTVSGHDGMIVGIPMLWFVGALACGLSRSLAICLIAGGVAVGLLQMIGFLHILAGQFAVGVVSRVGLEITSPAGALLATCLTGAFLMAIAGILGSIVLGIMSANEKGHATGVVDDRIQVSHHDKLR